MDVEEAGNLFLSQYKSDKQQFEGITPYQIQIVDTITFQNHSLVSLQRSGSEYLGGAHPIDWITYWNFKPTGDVYKDIQSFREPRIERWRVRIPKWYLHPPQEYWIWQG